MPEISIIIPVYNVEKYLKTCVESILSQDFSDFEIDFNLPEEVEDINLDDFFEDAPPKEKEPKKIQCPHCGEWFEI